MTIIITLSFAGNETGPFDLYSDATGFAIPFAQNVSKAALLAGYQVEAPDGTTVVRLDNLNSLCGSTDIYSCATPNCDFTGSIICDVTTTTTTTPPPTTTTTTSLPPATLCTWTSFGGDSGEIGVYDMINNTVSAVLVPNDFTVTQGVTRPICATQTKLWLSGETDETSLNFVIKEYNINSTSNPPTLSFVREINVSLANISENSITFTGIQCTTITAINDTTLVVGFGGPTATNNCPTVAGYNIDISDTGNIALSLPSSSSDRISLGAAVNTCSGTVSNPGVLYLNNGQVITSFRLDFDNPNNNAIGNWIQQKTLDSGFNQENLTNAMKLQDLGIPEFTSSYTGEKYMDIFSREGVLYVLHPETLVLYTIEQQPPYTAVADFTVISDAPSVFSTTGCSNVDLYYEDPCDSVIVLPWLNVREENGTSGPYIGPVSFDYQGMTVEGSSISATSSPTGFVLNAPWAPGYVGPYTGLVIPEANGVTLKGQFDYTITFPQPVNNIPIRVGVLNTTFSNGQFIQGDIYQADTNTETPTITISNGYGVNVVGNQFGGGVYGDNSTNGEFIISCETDYTVLTISGTAPTGGPIALACTQPPLNCRLVYSTESAGWSCSSPSNEGRCLPGQRVFKKYFAWDVNTNTQQEILLPPLTATESPNFALSENYIIVDVSSLVTGVKSLARYGYTDINGIPSDTTFDGQFIDYPPGNVRNHGSIMEAVTDTKFLGTWQQGSNQSFPTAVSQILEWELSGTTLSYSVKIDVGVNHGYYVSGDLLLTLKTDGTPNKIITMGYVPPLQSDNSNPGYLLQFDYTTNALDGVVNLPAGVRGSAALGIYDGGIYIGPPDWSTVAPEFAGVWRLDLETLQWTQLDSADVPTEMGLPDPGPGDFASTPICRVSDGITSFNPPPLDCTLIYATPSQDCASNPGACYPNEPYYSDVFAYNPITGITEQLIFPAGTNFGCQGISISENYITITLTNTEYAFTRYTYDLSSTGVPENIQWEGILYTWPSEWSTGLKIAGESINDTKTVFLYGFNRVLEVEIIEGSTVLSVTQKFIVQSNAQGDCLITYKPDGVTPNKVLYHQFQGTSRRIYQYDYNTGTLDGSISTPLLSNGSYLSSGDLTMIGNYIYTSDISSGVFYRYNTVTSVWEIVPEQPNPGTALDSGSRPECRISDGITSFNPPPTTTTTTTIFEGVNTIWTWFEAETPV